MLDGRAWPVVARSLKEAETKAKAQAEASDTQVDVQQEAPAVEENTEVGDAS